MFRLDFVHMNFFHPTKRQGSFTIIDVIVFPLYSLSIPCNHLKVYFIYPLPSSFLLFSLLFFLFFSSSYSLFFSSLFFSSSYSLFFSSSSFLLLFPSLPLFSSLPFFSSLLFLSTPLPSPHHTHHPPTISLPRLIPQSQRNSTQICYRTTDR